MEQRRQYRDKLLAGNQRWYERNKVTYLAKRAADRDPKKSRQRWMGWRYGVTEEQYALMARAQGGRCAICSERPEKLHIDHDHENGQIRGLLCHRCNVGLGLFRETPAYMISAIEYLVTHGSVDNPHAEEVA